MAAFALLVVILACAIAASATSCNEKCIDGFCASGLSCTGGICTGEQCQSTGGDLEMKGLEGPKFYFGFEAGKSFNLISEKEHQVNALFVEGPQKSSEGKSTGNLIGAMGLKLYDTKIHVEVDEEGEMTVAVNDKIVNLTAANHYEHNIQEKMVNITVHKYRDGTGQTLHVMTNLYNLLIHALPRQWDEDAQQVTRSHLNLALAVEPSTYILRVVHGILGQITPDTAGGHSFLPVELQTTFLGVGKDKDYIVSDLFADDFKFNRFNLATPLPASKAAASRNTASRRLIEQPGSAETVWLSILEGNFGSV